MIILVVLLCLTIVLLAAYGVWRKKVFLMAGICLVGYLLLGPILIGICGGIAYSVRAFVDHPIASLLIFFSMYFGCLFSIERTKRVNSVEARHALSLALAAVFSSLLAWGCLHSLHL